MHRTKLGKRALVIISAIAFGVALSACGTNAATTTTTTTTATSVPSSSSSTSTSSTSATSPAPTCSSGVLAFTQSSAGTEAGTSSYAFTATNNGPSPCSLDGYPTLKLYGASPGGGAGAGDELPITAQDTGSSPQRVTLAAKGTAEFLLSIADVPVNGAGCSTVASIDVTPPGSSESIPVSDSLQACGASVQVTAFGPPGSAQA